MNNRRQFFKNLAAGTAGLLSLDAAATETPLPRKKQKIGLQLWTLRGTVERDTPGTLKKVSKAGYDLIEPYGYDGKFYGIEAAGFKKMCADLGLKITATHTGITAENAAEFAGEAGSAGLEYLVIPSAGSRSIQTLDDYRRFAAELNSIGQKVKKAGLKFGYHNHSHEFAAVDDMVPYDLLLAETDPELVCFELDLFWIKKAGFEPVAYFAKYPGRFALWHLKDMAANGESTIIGTGSIDFKEIFKHAKQAGLQHFFVEQEEYDRDPADCTALSCKYIRRHLL